MHNQEEEVKPTNKPETLKAQTNKVSEKIGEDDDSSEWSLDSLEDMKGVNLKELEEEENMPSHQPKEKLIEVKFPDKPTILANAPLHEIGKIVFIVGELFIVQASTGSFVVDLDNWVSDEYRNLIGFVIDVLGRIQTPYYAIKPESMPQNQNWLGRSLYYIEGSSKILKDDDIKSMQSKSAVEVQDIDDSSDEQLQQMPERKYSQERRDNRRERRRSPAVKRDSRFRQEQRRQHSRDRTRERQQYNRHHSRARNQHNQKYLETMYNMHYTQMMRLYNGNFNPNPNPNPMPFSQPPFPQQGFSHSNVANFGASSNPQQPFYGQNFNSGQQANNPQGYTNWMGNPGGQWNQQGPNNPPNFWQKRE